MEDEYLPVYEIYFNVKPNTNASRKLQLGEKYKKSKVFNLKRTIWQDFAFDKFQEMSKNHRLIKVIKIQQQILNFQVILQKQTLISQLKTLMQNQPNDINLQIDRILSCNIRQQILSGIPMELLQSPVISKNHSKFQAQSSGKRSEKRSELEEDLYEKAEQIFKLKEVLENELANINQIVVENQKLTEMNENLKQELRKVRNQWKQFKISINDQLQKQVQSMRKFHAEQIELFKGFMGNNKLCKSQNKISIVSCEQIIKKSVQISSSSSLKHRNLELIACSFSISIEPFKITINNKLPSTQTQTQQNFDTLQLAETLQVQVVHLNQTIIQLQNQNTFHLNTIKTLQEEITKLNLKNINQPEPLQQKQLNHQQKSIERYSSIFMKSIFEQDQNIDSTIRTALFNPQKSIFDQLQEGKYFGKIVSRTKNCNAIEQYKNGFQYEGRFLKNQRNGLGKLFYKDRLIYAGEWKQGKFSGKGIIYYDLNLNVQKIQANFNNGRIEGLGSITFKSGQKIRAHFKNNLIQSQAMIILGDNDKLQSEGQKTVIGKVQFIKDKQNTFSEHDKFMFKGHSGRFLRIY